MKIHFISSPVVDEDCPWQLPGVHDVSGSYQSRERFQAVQASYCSVELKARRKRINNSSEVIDCDASLNMCAIKGGKGRVRRKRGQGGSTSRSLLEVLNSGKKDTQGVKNCLVGVLKRDDTACNDNFITNQTVVVEDVSFSRNKGGPTNLDQVVTVVGANLITLGFLLPFPLTGGNGRSHTTGSNKRCSSLVAKSPASTARHQRSRPGGSTCNRDNTRV